MSAEIAGLLRLSGSAVMGAGQAVISFDPPNARQRWEVTGAIISTDQPATATAVPVAAVVLNAADRVPVSQGGKRSHSWDGNMVTLPLRVQAGPADSVAVVFTDPGAASAESGVYLDTYTATYPGTAMDGTVCYATITGTRYTRRA
jgi:hypothetical protein